jgi:O-antigen/teichoic acid export membrane protein
MEDFFIKRQLPQILLGRILKSLVPLVAVVLYTKDGDFASVGEFGYSQSLAIPLTIFFGLNLRRIVATDVEYRITPRTAFALRALGFSALASTIFLAERILGGSNILFLVLGTRVVDSMRDLAYGFFQLHDRQQFISESQMVEGLLSLVGVITLNLNKFTLSDVCVWILCVNITIALAYDLRKIIQLTSIKEKLYAESEAMGVGRLFSVASAATLPPLMCSGVGFIPNLIVKVSLSDATLGLFVFIRTIVAPFDFVFEVFRNYSLSSDARSRILGDATYEEKVRKRNYFGAAIGLMLVFCVLFLLAQLIEFSSVAFLRKVADNGLPILLCCFATFFRILVGYYQNILFIHRRFKLQSFLESVSPLMMIALMYPLAKTFGLLGVCAGLVIVAVIDLILIKSILKTHVAEKG